MSRSILGEFLKTSSKRFAKYTGYVHFGVYASVWLAIASLIYLISGCETVNIYLMFVLGLERKRLEWDSYRIKYRGNSLCILSLLVFDILMLTFLNGF